MVFRNFKLIGIWHICQIPIIIFFFGVFIRFLVINDKLSKTIKNKSSYHSSFKNHDQGISFKTKHTFKTILLNNSIIVLILLSSWLLACVPAITILFFNGFQMADTFIMYKIFDNPKLLILIVPHVFIEFFSFFLAAGFSFEILKELLASFKEIDYKRKKIHYFVKIVFSSVFFVILGAIIEFYFTFKIGFLIN
jgi:uncharacterized membrane protein SpoIIM required for sporulation